MNPIYKVVSALHATATHPMNQHRKLKAVLEYGFIQVGTRLIPGEVCVRFPNDTRLLISPQMKGAAHYITPGLCEFEPMAFVVHFLRPGGRFLDVGANIGAFTVLAAGVAKANVTAFEASPDTFQMLQRNISLNGLTARVEAIHAAAGKSEGTVQFTVGLGTENCVTSANGTANSEAVRLTTVDTALKGSCPDLMKVDVEGFETEVFAGAAATLANQTLKAIIIERCNVGNRYGFDENLLHEKIRREGFTPCSYEPFSRQLTRLGNDADGNIIYVRDHAAASEMVKAAPPFQLRGLTV